jgi:hypothetical protein
MSPVIDDLAGGLGRLMLAVPRLLGRFVLELVGEAVLEAITDRWSRRRAKKVARRARA